MKKVIWVIVIICLLLATYHCQPQIKEKINSYWASYITGLVTDDAYSHDEKVDELLILSLNFRNQDEPELAMKALQLADSLDDRNVLIDGLLGLYYMERGEKEKVIQSWKAGALVSPDDPNLSYLSTLDTAELIYVDNHMLEEMFVDTVINSRLDNPLYHKFDDNLMQNTEKKIRIESSINNTFVISSIASFFILLYSIVKVRRIIKRRKMKKSAAESTDRSEPIEKEMTADSEAEDETAEEEEKHDTLACMPKPVKYMIAISSMIKIGQVVAALFNYFTLGSDISDFVSSYVFAPSNLVSLFTNNLLFAGIFLVIMIVEIVRRKLVTQ